MIHLQGKYAHAKVFLPNTPGNVKNTAGVISDEYHYLDDATHHQILSFLNHPAFAGRNVRIMPDTHYGKGSCVGFTMDLGDHVIPNIVGVDIGCGILATKLPLKYIETSGLADLDGFIRSHVPSGFSIHPKPQEHLIKEVNWFEEKNMPALLSSMSHGMEIDYNRVMCSLGTLGGGNHFIELGRDEEGFLWLTIHSGSRNFGLQVAQFHQKLANEECAKWFQNFGDLNFLPKTSIQGHSYISCMEAAQKYASMNRHIMQKIILQGFFGVEPMEEIDSVHNYIDFNDKIIRKGATAANEGQKLVIPFNMEDGLIIATGKGNKDWNCSAPHGAGRILSRNVAKKSLSLDQAKAGMDSAGVFTTSLSQDTLDEAKLAYKPMDLILNMIEDTVTVDIMVRPVYNFKAK